MTGAQISSATLYGLHPPTSDNRGYVKFDIGIGKLAFAAAETQARNRTTDR
jgi:hypothetical protein